MNIHILLNIYFVISTLYLIFFMFLLYHKDVKKFKITYGLSEAIQITLYIYSIYQL